MDVNIKNTHLDRYLGEFHVMVKQMALVYCEALTKYDLPAFPGIRDALARHFGKKSRAEFVINMNPSTRLKMAQGNVLAVG